MGIVGYAELPASGEIAVMFTGDPDGYKRACDESARYNVKAENAVYPKIVVDAMEVTHSALVFPAGTDVVGLFPKIQPVAQGGVNTEILAKLNQQAKREVEAKERLAGGAKSSLG